MNDKTKSDYPHNPFLYILLYSGLVGLILYLVLLWKVFYYYIKYMNEYYLFFTFFIITYFFTFFSGGNPFDPPIMGLFMILPFLINSIHELDVKAIEEVKIEE
jgi:O-antigen ligase